MHAFIYNFLAAYMLLHRCDLDLCGLPAVAWLCRVCAAGLCPPTEARWARLEALDCREGVSERRKGGRGTETLYPEEPVLNVVPGTSASLSGVSRHRDFIRSLPVHLAKWILGNGVL